MVSVVFHQPDFADDLKSQLQPDNNQDKKEIDSSPDGVFAFEAETR